MNLKKLTTRILTISVLSICLLISATLSGTIDEISPNEPDINVLGDIDDIGGPFTR